MKSDRPNGDLSSTIDPIRDEDIATRLQDVDAEVPAPPFRLLPAERLVNLARARRQRQLLVVLATGILVSGLLAMGQFFDRPPATPSPLPSVPIAFELEFERAYMAKQLAKLRESRKRERESAARSRRVALRRARVAVERSSLQGVAFANSEISDPDDRGRQLRQIVALYPDTSGAARAQRLLANFEKDK